jgi:hypothetical protein
MGAWELKSDLYPRKGTQSPLATSGPNESELNRVFNVRGLFFPAQTNETDTIVDTLGAVPVANVERHGVPFHVEEQPIQLTVSYLIPEAKMAVAYPLVTCRTRCSAQPILLNLGVVYTLVTQETL